MTAHFGELQISVIIDGNRYKNLKILSDKTTSGAKFSLPAGYRVKDRIGKM